MCYYGGYSSFGKEYAEDLDRYIMFDAFVMDLAQKKVSFLYEGVYGYDGRDSFVDEFNGVDGKSSIENIDVNLNDETGCRTIEITYSKSKKATIVVDRDNRFIEYHNHYLSVIPD